MRNVTRACSLLLVLALPCLAAAQARGTARQARMAGVTGGQAVVRTRPAARPPGTARVSQATTIAVPGLGFDYPHLAAVGGTSTGIISPLSRQRGSNRGASFTPILLGGYGGVSYIVDSEESQEPRQPQIIVIQQPATVAPGPTSVALPSNGAAVGAAEAPVRDIGEFILVRRDGNVLFAAGYSIIGPNVRWVSREGLRQTLPLAEIDAIATAAMNEARGVTLLLQN